MEKDDKQLIEAALVNRKDFSLLYQKYSEKVFNYFWYRLGHDTEVAEDLTQDVFLRALGSLARYQEKNYSYLTYLLTIAHNVLVDYYKKPKNLSLDDLDIDIAGEIPEEVVKGLDNKKEAERAWQMMQNLPLPERDVLLLYYHKNLKVAEIAKIKGKSENAIKLILSRARQKLKNTRNLNQLSRFGYRKMSVAKRKFIF